MLIPLALTQFIASFARSNMNVAITNISKDLDTTHPRRADCDHAVAAVHGGADDPRQQLTDIWGRKRCLIRGLSLYGIGAVIAALAPGFGVVILGYSLFEASVRRC